MLDSECQYAIQVQDCKNKQIEQSRAFARSYYIVLLNFLNLIKIFVLKSALLNLSFYLSMHCIRLECNASEPSN